MPRSGRGTKVLWLTPLINAKTLHEVVYDPQESGHFDQWIRDTYDEFLGEMQKLWVHTKDSTSPDLREIYISRIWNRVERLEHALKINSLRDMSIVVNERDPIRFGDVMNVFTEEIGQVIPPFSCTTHSDEHARNIMIFEEAERRHDKTGWVIIDYASARKQSDWILSIAKMLQWWDYYCVLEQAKYDFNVKQTLRASPSRPKNGRWVISYDEKALKDLIPTRCSTLRQRVYTFAKETGEILKEDEQIWSQRLELALFSIIIASAPLHFGKADFMVPIMIGEGLKHFSQFLEKRNR
jgi:hypothetical protein